MARPPHCLVPRRSHLPHFAMLVALGALYMICEPLGAIAALSVLASAVGLAIWQRDRWNPPIAAREFAVWSDEQIRRESSVDSLLDALTMATVPTLTDGIPWFGTTLVALALWALLVAFYFAAIRMHTERAFTAARDKLRQGSSTSAAASSGASSAGSSPAADVLA